MTRNGAAWAAIAAAVGIGCGGQTSGQPADGGQVESAPVNPPVDASMDTFQPMSVESGVPEAGKPEAGTPEGSIPEAGLPETGPVPEAGCTGTGCPHDYAIKQLFLGDTDRSGVESSTAWESFGQNLDGLDTTITSEDVCTLTAGATKQVQQDGNGGIDNSWGANLVPTFLELDSTFSTSVNDAIAVGEFTNLFYVVGFDDTAGNMTTSSSLSGVTLLGGDYMTFGSGGVPTFSLATNWPINPASLDCPMTGCPSGTDPIASAKSPFAMASQSAGMFLSGAPVDYLLSLPLSGGSLQVPIHSTFISFAPNAPGSVTNGTVAGVMATTDLVAAFNVLAGGIDPSLCTGSALGSIDQELEQDSDIVYDAATGAVSNTAGVSCNAISIGIGFNAAEIAAPTSADIEPPVPAANPCGDGG